jgi:hypothetical protein
MRVAISCEVRRDGELVLEGLADLQSGPRGWRANVIASAGYSVRGLADGIYQLVLPSGASHDARLDSVRQATREARFVGIDDPPAEITRRPNVPRSVRFTRRG